MCVYHLLSPALLAVTARLAAHRLPPVAMCAPPETLFDGAASLPIGEALQRLGIGCSVAAVYTIEDEAGEVLYVGTSRNVAVSLRAHREAMPDRVSAVRLQDFSSPARREMEEVKRAWIRSLGRTPEGNDGRAQEWADALRSAVFAPISSARPRASAAMGSATGEPEQSAVESSSPGERASPFEAAASGAAASSAAASGLELTAAAVDSVLNEVRPYLVADGGNVAVVSVDAATRNVYLRLEGACGSCPSSTVTMKMGIERVLREKFGSLGDVVAVQPDDDDDDDDDDEADGALDVSVANAALEQIMPAILGLGGSVEVVSAAGSTVQLKYSGPDKIKFGVELALRDSPLIEKVEFV